MKRDCPIAIVGMGGVFPGAADLRAFWNNIAQARDMTREVPPGRWIIEPHRAIADAPSADKVLSVRGCFVEDFRLDPAGLEIDRHLLSQLDPLYHFVLHAGRDAYRHARMDGVDHDRIGVILAAIALPTDASSAITRETLGADFERRLFEHAGIVSAREREKSTVTHQMNGRVVGLPAALLAQALGLGGGTYTLDAACASSLYAVKLACDELRSGRADAMLAGGVSRPECLYTQMGFTQLRALSPSGRCAPFDASCDGLVVGEGAGVIVLKRLDDAVAAGDEIHGVIRGIGLSNDIGGSLLAPDSEGQLRAMRQAYEAAGWTPDSVDLIECHGTGTPTGDAVEIQSMRTLWEEISARSGQCAIGSVKSMIGHLLTGAGAAGLIKVLLAMRHETLPPSANYRDHGGAIPLKGSPFRVQVAPEPWAPRDRQTPRRAAISAFGFGGINAHVLVEEYLASVEPERSRLPSTIIIAPTTEDPTEPIAIVGMGAHFGDAASLAEFRRVAFGGALQRTEIDQLKVVSGRFRIPPMELPEILPQQLLMLDVVAEAMMDAGMPLRERRPNVGVLIGMSLDFNTTNFHLRWWLPSQARRWARRLGIELSPQQEADWVTAMQDAICPALNATRTLGALGGIIASRIACEFQLGGPSFAVSCEETSGLKGLEVAVRALRAREMDAVVVGAIDLATDSRAAMTSAGNGDQHVGDGAAALVVKRLSDALRDEDRIYAVIRGLGHASGDAVKGSAALLRACEDADVKAASVGLVEFAGSSETSPDIQAAFSEVPQLVALSSSTLCVGHCGAATGMASLIRAALCLHHATLPGTRASLSPLHNQSDSFHFPVEPQYWLRDRVDGPRRALVSATTSDGNSACVILEEQEPLSTRSRAPVLDMPTATFAVEASDVAQLVRGLTELRGFAETASDGLGSLAARWLREHSADTSKRLAVAIVADSSVSLVRSIDSAQKSLRDKPTEAIRGQDGVFFFPDPLGGKGDLAFVFPGSGNHYLGMGRELALHFPQVVDALDAQSDRLAGHFSPQQLMPWRCDWPNGWRQEAMHAVAHDVERLIFGQVSFGVLASDILQLAGLRPRATIGYSLGESVGLFALRAWPDRDEMFRRMSDSPLFKSQLAGPRNAIYSAWRLPPDAASEWCAAVVAKPVEVVRQALVGLHHARLLIVNTPTECVVGGLRRDVHEAARRAGSRAITIDGVPTVHFEAVNEVEQAYRQLHLLPTSPPDGIRFYSAAAGKAYNVSKETAAESITAQAIHGFDFPAVIRQAYADGVRLFVEVGPQASCTRMIDRILEGRSYFAASASGRADEELHSLMALLAGLIAQRVPVNLAGLYRDALDDAASSRLPGHAVIEISTRLEQLPPPLPTPQRSMALGETLPARPSREDSAGEGIDESADVFMPSVPGGGDEFVMLRDAVLATAARTTAAHDAYLRFSESASRELASVLTMQAELLESAVGKVDGAAVLSEIVNDNEMPISPRQSVPPVSLRRAAAPAYSRELCLEFARGKVANVLGPKFEIIDGYRTRVRLPDEPLMLVDRIMSVNGTKGVLGPGRVVTEHDVLPGAWYLDSDRCPICITVEAGQADLFLSGYLGIDFVAKGVRSYRLLDATVTFHRDLPRPGETIHYDIRIDRFVRQGETYMFFFEFDGTIDGEPVLTMRKGCAGFFTTEEIRQSHGLVLRPEETRPSPRTLPDGFAWPVGVDTPGTESFGDDRIAALRRGELADCFGQQFADLALANPPRLPGGPMKLIDRVLELNANGGRYGLGMIYAEADVHPDDWYLTCHFVDDMVMPGTLMYECTVHTLRVFLLRMGWIADQDDLIYEPIPGIASALRCRGPVTPATKKASYRVEIKEVGYRPEPYVLADALMYADGVPIVQMTNMSLQLTGLTRERIESLWRGKSEVSMSVSATRREPIFSGEQILAFAVGKPSDCFGEPYRIFDGDSRRIARLPGPPYQFLDRVTSVEPPPFVLKADGWIEAEYDVPPDAWYFAANRQVSMPFAVLLEIALQPCGFLAAYAGSALTSEDDLSFRNLGGEATLHDEVFADAGTLRIQVRMTNVSRAGGMIIEHFDMRVLRGDLVIYDGTTSFGFFSREALARQVGIRDAGQRMYMPTDTERTTAKSFDLPKVAPMTPDEAGLIAFDGQSAGAAMPAQAFRMLDRVDVLIPDGGPHALGFVQGSAKVDPSAWFFKAHFYQDPVWPGSLGLESMLQLMKAFALDRWPHLAATHRFEPIAVGMTHEWFYRGQIIPTNERVEVQATITRREEGDQPLLVADGFLTVDGTVIYEMRNFGLRMVPM
ncbi:MAG: type I polyketide synthase [Planctomycetia bacterium]|nr:type I polyketide synthase [Planctomycetia bacterium]MCC7314539.1 type I polyketide synthase [Planctomycetota bacterium]OQZ05179.1 MAG: hypothetical protein B6D36_11445 [Planctomycetes bacterium UTPLA1]